MNDDPSDLDRLLADFERLTAGAPRPAPAVGRTLTGGIGRLAQAVAVLAVVGVVGVVFVGALALTSPTGGPPATVDGLPVMTVGQVLDARAAGGLRDQQVAVGGYWSASDIALPCAPPITTPGVLEMYCEDGLSGITQRNEPIAVMGSAGVTRASGPHLTPYIPSGVEGLGDLGPGGTAWGAGDGHAPVPIVVVGHFDDPLAADCRPEARQTCLDRLVVDKIAYFAADVTVSPTAQPTPTPAPTASAAGHVARLEVTSSGKMPCTGEGGCSAWLVLRQAQNLSDWQPNPNDPAFSATPGGSSLTVENAPSEIGGGEWTVGLAYAQYSDVAICNSSPCLASFPVLSQGVACTAHFVVADDTEAVSIAADFGPPCSIDVVVNPAQPSTSVAPPPPSPSLADNATAACSSSIDGLAPMVTVRSGTPTVAAAYEVTGEQLTRYFDTKLEQGGWPNGADWWGQPDKLVDLCILDGDFDTETPGPPGHNTLFTEILVVIDNGQPFAWVFSDQGQIPTTDPATIQLATSSPAAQP